MENNSDEELQLIVDRYWLLDQRSIFLENRTKLIEERKIALQRQAEIFDKHFFDFSDEIVNHYNSLTKRLADLVDIRKELWKEWIKLKTQANAINEHSELIVLQLGQIITKQEQVLTKREIIAEEQEKLLIESEKIINPMNYLNN